MQLVFWMREPWFGGGGELGQVLLLMLALATVLAGLSFGLPLLLVGLFYTLALILSIFLVGAVWWLAGLSLLALAAWWGWRHWLGRA